MSPEQWERLRTLFHEAVDLPPDERDDFLKAACTNHAIRVEVESLLGHADGTVLNSPAVKGVREAIGAAITGNTNLTVIGRYRLLKKIGEGGMGEVWLAEQREPIHRQVALKLIKAGISTREVIARFESERQTLALMDHPAIAKVFDAGSTPEGAPYFVMEYVAGVPITAFCDNHELTIGERLELFMRVCEGVQHAHQKAIIHRDLKPSNILVIEVDGKAVPKIIDFGIAKALSQKLTEETLLTRVGAMIGTPEYMSPEQASLAGADIDTRTDVYSLGIVFYELLAGVPPVELRNIPLEEFLRRLLLEEPKKPSARILAQDEVTSSEAALKRGITPAALVKQLRGDLDSIALKALERDRSRRYGSPIDLAADIGRHLSNERVLAVAASRVYRARKFARRHRAALIITAAFMVVLIAAAAISIRQSIRANREARAAQAVNDFLQNDLLAQASPNSQARPNLKPDPRLEVRTALDRAAVRIAGKFDRQPDLEAEIRDTIGQTYMDLGLYPEARAQLERARDLHSQMLGAKDPKTLKTISRLGRSAYLQGKYPEAESILSNTLETQRRGGGGGQHDTVASASNLANVYYKQGKYWEAAALHSRALEIRGQLLGPEHPDTLASMIDLAIVYWLQGNLSQAEALFSRALEIERRVLGPSHKNTLMTMNNLAVIYLDEGKYTQAEELQIQCLELRRSALGVEHPDTLMSMLNLANVYLEQGKYAQAEALFKEIWEIRSRVLDPEHPDTLNSMNNLAYVYGLEKKYAQAEPLFSKTLEIAVRKLGEENRNTIIFLSNFASIYQREGKYSLAETYAARSLAGLRHTRGGEHADTMELAADLALALQSQGKFTESEPLAREAVDFDRKKQPDHWQRFRAESLLGASLAGLKKYAEAEPLLLEGYQGMLARKERIAVPDWYHLDRAREWIVELYQAWGQPRKADEWKKK